MPRVALTQQQREQNKIDDICKLMLDELNMKRGLLRVTDEEFSKKIGVCRNTWRQWNKRGILGAEFGQVIQAAVRCGLTVEVH
ncbi:MAG: hypothetical protein LUG44_09300 [Clostridiales bacterium]|nr:hypothetical protein [Clostridiales bacterium]